MFVVNQTFPEGALAETCGIGRKHIESQGVRKSRRIESRRRKQYTEGTIRAVFPGLGAEVMRQEITNFSGTDAMASFIRSHIILLKPANGGSERPSNQGNERSTH